MRKTLSLLGLAAVGLGILVMATWPSQRPAAGYPLARRAAAGQASPLWSLSPAELDSLLKDDTARLAQSIRQLEGAIGRARRYEELLSRATVAELPADDRAAIRGVWWSSFEPLLFVDDLKHRYEAWWGLDYVKHPRLHSRAYALSFAALAAEWVFGQELVGLVRGRGAQKLFDERMKDYGLPKGTFTELRGQLTKSRDLMLLPTGSTWYDQWIEKHLERRDPLRGLVKLWRDRALQLLGPEALSRMAKNQADTLKGRAFQRWFPVQKKVATWVGDTRLAAESRRLISDAQVSELEKRFEPGDIIVERRNWYLSNVGLPGFWPHAALYVGTHQELRARFDEDSAVTEKYGRFSEYLAKTRANAWRALGQPDAEGHPRSVLEAVSEGVVTSSVEHSCGADYVAVLRPRLDPLEVARAIDQALSYFGRPYDFDFNFATDDAVVCSELVLKAYEPDPPDMRGLSFPFVTIAGRRSVPPTQIVRAFAEGRAQTPGSLEFVYFLDGREEEKRAVIADAEALAATVDRPKWDLLQP